MNTARPTSAHTRRALRGLLAIRLLGALADATMLPFVVLWAVREISLDGGTAGAVFLAQGIGEMAGGLLGGHLADRFGRRRVLLASTAGMAVGYGSLAAVTKPTAAITLFVVAGLFESAFHPTINAAVGDLSEDADLHRNYGLVRVAANVGRVLGPLLGASVVAFWASGVFAVAGVLLAGAALAVLATVPSGLPADTNDVSGTDPAGSSVHQGLGAAVATAAAIARDGRLALLILGGGLLSITYTWWQADGLVLLRQQHPVSATGYASLFTVAALATVAFQVPTSRWARRHSATHLVLTGAAVQGLGLGSLAFAHAGWPVMIASAIAIALGQMLYAPAVSAHITRTAGAGRRATYQAAISTTEDIGSAIGPTSGLALGSAAPAGVVWVVALPVSLLAGALSASAVRHTPSKSRLRHSTTARRPLRPQRGRAAHSYRNGDDDKPADARREQHLIHIHLAKNG